MNPATVVQNADVICTIKEMVRKGNGGVLHWHHGQHTPALTTIFSVLKGLEVGRVILHTRLDSSQMLISRGSCDFSIEHVPIDKSQMHQRVDFVHDGKAYSIVFDIRGEVDTKATVTINTKRNLPCAESLPPIPELSSSV